MDADPTPGAARAPAPAAAPPPPKQEVRSPLPSDFPAALGSLDEPDLPVVSADLPAAKLPAANLPAAKRPPPRPGPRAEPRAPAPRKTPALVAPADSFGGIDLDLPAVPADLPEARRGPPKPPPLRPRSMEVGLPSLKADLPAPKSGSTRDLPAVAAHLPEVVASLPGVAAGLPMAAASLPSPIVAPPVSGFGEIDLPMATDSLPASLAADHPAPASHSPFLGTVSFGEIELPREPPGVPAGAPTTSRDPSADFGRLELDDKPRSRRSSPRNAAVHDPDRGGGMTFGEVDLTSPHEGAAAASSSISVVAALPGPDGESGAAGKTARRQPEGVGAPAGAQAAATALVRTEARGGGRDAAVAPARRRSVQARVGLAALVAAVLAGAALQLTPHGAFGYLDVADRIHAKDYERAAAQTIGTTEKALGADTYDEAKAAVDAAAAAHAHMPRARPLTAYAAVVDFATTVRFGPDASRASRATQLLAELPPDEPVKYRDVALAAQAAANEEVEKARKALDAAASKNDPADPIQVVVAHLRGNFELASRDGAAALLAFKRALGLSNDARAHFGLARAYELVGDPSNAKKEIDATLATSPRHPGALTLRARMNRAPADDAQSIKDLATILDGPARAKAAPSELSKAYAVRAWISLELGGASEAREAFAQAVSLDPRNALALGGEGRLLLGDGRYTEALARFDAALQIDPTSADAIADDAEAKLALDRLADAKRQLTEGRERFPKSLPIVLLLGRVEQKLGNDAAAESDMRAAVAMVDPSRRDAIQPYVALSELLSSRGKLADARSVLDDAKKSLASSGALDRALGDVAELQGDHDLAMAEYRAAISRDPRDAAAHFRLAVTLRRMRRFEEATSELDKVVAVDREYPGLSLERGLLFEDSGDVQRAIEQFTSALARAPDDPDLQLRVGSAYVSIGRPDDAIPMLRKVLQRRPTSAEAQHYLGRALMLKGSTQEAEAIRYLQRAVDADPNRAEFHVYLAWAANEATPAQFDLAAKEIESALSLDKLNAESYWQRGLLERKQGAVIDAIKDEKRALELRPSRYEAHAALAECYEDRSDYAAALAEWAKAVAGAGDGPGPDGGVPYPYWRYKYGRLLVDRGHFSAAASLLLPAATTMERSELRPGWLPNLEVSTAQALDKLGRRAEAAEHYRRFLDVAPVNSPDRADAQSALARLAGER